MNKAANRLSIAVPSPLIISSNLTPVAGAGAGAGGPTGGPTPNSVTHGAVNESLRQNLTKEMFAELEETFAQASEGTGILPVAKLAITLKALGMSVTESDPKLHNGDIDFDRFLEIVLTCMKLPNWVANELNESYELFDREKSGNIGPTELRVVFARLGENLLEKELEDQLREFDIDGDLLVSI
eukprot:scaffold77_cov243-Ochromonas_danica.AAC.7